MENHRSVSNFWLALFLCLPLLLMGVTIHVNQDGTGDFTTVQSAISASADGDSVLVWPGRYVENIDYQGKAITVCSRYSIEADRSLMDSTILDGNRTGSTVRIINCNGAALDGFTIVNGAGYNPDTGGIGYMGGGIYISQSSVTIRQCNVSKNYAMHGAGICCETSHVSFYRTSVHHNHGQCGGGISLYNTTASFDPDNRCSVYHNYSATGSDLLRNENCPTITAYVDTFTVAQPDGFFMISFDDRNREQFILNALHYEIEPYRGELYVSPTGNDDNAGRSPESPLKTIAEAAIRIAPDSTLGLAIHLADGVYSASTGQKFPVGMRSFVSLVGESQEETVLDGENETMLIYDYYSNLGYTIENLSLKNATSRQPGGLEDYSGAYEFGNSRDCSSQVTLRNLTIEGCAGNTTTIGTMFYVTAILDNVTFTGNTGPSGLVFWLSPYVTDQVVTVRNSRFVDNDAPALYFFMDGAGGRGHARIINSLFADCRQHATGWAIEPSAVCVADRMTLDVVNCTFTDNTTVRTSGAITQEYCDSQVNIYNSIVYGNISYELYMSRDIEGPPQYCFATNSLISANCFISYDCYYTPGNNMLDCDPQLTQGYLPANGSPVIDAGSLTMPADLRALLPDTDLAGNPRIVGDVIDLGCYEWAPSTAGDDSPTRPVLSASASPNPFNPSTTISYSLPQSGRAVLSIYDIRGRVVRMLMNETQEAGEHTAMWNGTDDNGRALASGVYLYRLDANGKSVTRKCVLMK
jgi:hypothetical protein